MMDDMFGTLDTRRTRMTEADAQTRTARLLAGIIGPTMIATTTTEWVNLHIWAQPSPTLTYLNGMVLFIAGISALRLHHSLARSWTTTVTAAGGLLFVSGLLRMAFPEAPQPRDGLAAEAVIAAVLGFGCLLTWLGYRPERRADSTAIRPPIPRQSGQ